MYLLIENTTDISVGNKFDGKVQPIQYPGSQGAPQCISFNCCNRYGKSL